MGQNIIISNETDDSAQILEAIRTGCVDAFVVEEREGHTVYTLHNADLPYSTLVQRMQQGAAMLNASGNLIYCNVSFAVLLGMSADSLIGVRLQELVHEDDVASLQKLLRAPELDSREGEVRLRKVDGIDLWVRLSLNPLSRDGAITGVLVTDLTTEKSNAELAARIQSVQDEERRNIARELHDSVGQLLTAVAMNLGLLRNAASSLSPAHSKLLDDSNMIVAEVTKEIRTISHLLHPPLLGVAGLSAAIRWYVDGFSERSRIAVEVDVPDELGRVSSEVEIALFRVVQECLTNVYRHSGCDSCWIKLEREENWLHLQIRDDGKGIQSRAKASTGVGIRGMKERMRHLGGSLEVVSSESGTTVTAHLPAGEVVGNGEQPSVQR
ncbi:MAG TPA: PAS domain-containing sensor histidine kinase [Candidatus Eisenbacteria bacterium]|nr:PAS domain-containing sensor histidine kinase [Candidatus Eisenbacteria bacterium]